MDFVFEPVYPGSAESYRRKINTSESFGNGLENEVHNTAPCRNAVTGAGLDIWKDENGGEWSFENCLCPRYTTPDESGRILMDYCYFVK